MSLSAEDAALYSLVTATQPASIPEVIALMEAIDAALPDTDGLKWFNRLYLAVTREVDTQPPSGGWQDFAWLSALDVVFAIFYFNAIKAWADGSATLPSSWRALMQARCSPGIDRIQFAVAGMNAHINHDLGLALLVTDQQFDVVPTIGSSQHIDYEAVNELLQAVMPAELTLLAGDTLGMLAQDTGKVGRLLAFWNLCAARDFAWDFADHLRGLNGPSHQVALTLQDQMTGVVGRAILAFETPPLSLPAPSPVAGS